MKKPPYIKVYVKDFAFDIQDMSDEEVGIYMRGFLSAYKSGKIPKKYAVESLFIELKKSLASYHAVCTRNSKNRAKSDTYKNDSSTTGQRLVNDSVNQEPRTKNHEVYIPPIVPQGGSEKPKKKGQSKGSRLSEDWTLPEEWGDWAEELGFNFDEIVKESHVFRDYWIAKTGATAVKKDWFATWRNWMRRKQEYRK